MNQRRPWILLPIILLVLVAGIARETRAEGIFDRERFLIREGLIPDFRDEGKKVFLSREGLSPEPAQYKEAADMKSGDGRGERLYNVRLGYFHLFLTRYASGEGKGREIFRLPEGRNTFLGTVQSLPGTLRSDPARAMESVGTIFEPQVNLQIEF
ncbi:MAG: hypothetical protein NT047_10035 [Deltaproteobacteria bacterium]|nr:hypothetical protein [Deltaproteobacteria bacterium]